MKVFSEFFYSPPGRSRLGASDKERLWEVDDAGGHRSTRNSYSRPCRHLASGIFSFKVWFEGSKNFCLLDVWLEVVFTSFL